MMTVLVEHDDRLHCHEDGCHGDEVNLYAADPIDFISCLLHISDCQPIPSKQDKRSKRIEPKFCLK